MLRKLAGLIAVLILSGCLFQKSFPSKFSSNQVVYGRDFYAIQSKYWNISAMLKYPMPFPMASGSLDNTFGTSLDNIKSDLAVFKPTFYRVHLINAVCIRNNNCGPYEIGHGYNKNSFNAVVLKKDPKIINYVKQRTLAYRNVSTAYPGTSFIISPALEHDLTKQAWRNLADAVLSVWPDVQLANSPDGGIPIEAYKGSWAERHGNNPQSDSDIVSLDGADATKIDIDAFFRRVNSLPHVKVVFLWLSLDNCRINVWQDPRTRTHCPSSKTFELVSHLHDPVPVPIPFSGIGCKKILPFKAPDIWKPLAETQVNYDSRQELPVTIFSGFKPADLSVLASNGGGVGRLGWYGTYLKQGYRWYSGYKAGSKSSGYEFQKGAQASSGSPYVFLQQEGTCKGPLLPSRRQGLMRDK